MSTREFLTTADLAKRWAMHPTSLGCWRMRGKGPAFVKLGGKVLYSLTAVKAYEKRATRRRTA